MAKKSFAIPNISCEHCVMTIQKELGELDGVLQVAGDPDKKEITVDYEEPASLENIKLTLKEINYPAAE
jgi:copper chaperone CopZ